MHLFHAEFIHKIDFTSITFKNLFELEKYMLDFIGMNVLMHLCRYSP